MAAVATHPQKPVLEATALEVGLEFLLHVVRQGPDLPGQEPGEEDVHCAGPKARANRCARWARGREPAD